MPDTIRKQILNNLATYLENFTSSYGYSYDYGNTILRAVSDVDPDDLPAVGIFPGKDEVVQRDYGITHISMPVTVELTKNLLASEDTLNITEDMLGDVKTALTAYMVAVGIENGGTYEPQAGDIFIGQTSGAKGYVRYSKLVSGVWADGDASATVYLINQRGAFNAGSEQMRIGLNTNNGDITAVTASSAKSAVTGDLADDIFYTEGGVDSWPSGKESVVTVSAIFDFRYHHVTGDPYRKEKLT